ncbi:flagellin, partial [Campylobacter sp. RM12647]|uniref:flagellin n=1 Tax=Campylobacter sp. RM12647 TaxID=2735737 RepID=UPI001DDC9B25|nr:hypothetical protein [Campylobacter sp. RM12647]
RAGDLANLGNNDGKISLTFKNVDGINDVTLEPVQIAANVNTAGGKTTFDIKAGMGLGALAEAVNKVTDKTGIKASVTAQSVFAQPIKEGSTTEDFTINGVKIGKIEVKEKDGNGALRAAINSVKDQTGVEASVDSNGRLVLANRDGRGIKVEDGPTTYTKTAAEAKNPASTATINTTVGGAAYKVANGTPDKLAAAKAGDPLFQDVNNHNTGLGLTKQLKEAGVMDVVKENAAKDFLGALTVDGATGTITAQANLAGADTLGSGTTTGTIAADTYTGKSVDNIINDLKSKLADKIKAYDTAVKADKEIGNTAGTEAKAVIAAAEDVAKLEGYLKAATDLRDSFGMKHTSGLTEENSVNLGRLSLSSTSGKDIQVVAHAGAADMTSAIGFDKNVSEATVSLRETNAKIDTKTADAMGFNTEEWQAGLGGDNTNGYPAGVMTLKGAQAMMNIAENAQKALEAIRSDLGSVQNQLVSTVNNISVTQVNVKSAESNIRDVDFASESATFSKHQILAQSGVYAMSQANAVQQNVMRL